MHFRLSAALAVCCLFVFAILEAGAAQPAANLVPDKTKAFVSIPSVAELRRHFDDSTFGRLAADEQMKPFVDDLKQQFRQRLSQTEKRLGLTLEDIEAVQGGEVAIAAIQPAGDPNQFAFAVLLEATGRETAASQLLQRTISHLAAQGAQQSMIASGESAITCLTLPLAEGEKTPTAVYLFMHHSRLVVASHEGTAQYVSAALAAARSDSLASLPAFAAVNRRLSEADRGAHGQVQWFVEPFGFVEVMRAAQGGRKKRGMDMLKVLAHQGFNCIKGLGGEIAFHDGSHEVLHRTMIYAPAVERTAGAPSKDKYDLAARILNFPNGTNVAPESFISRDSSTYVTFHLKPQEIFDHVRTLVDEYAGAEGTYDEFIKNLAEDPSGPKIDLRKELIPYLGQRLSIVTDYSLPITTRSERYVAALEILHEQQMAAAIDKLFSTDPKARRSQLDGRNVWEIVNDEESPVADNLVKVEGVGLTPIAPAEKEEPKLPSVAITVAHGHLLIASNLDALRKITRPLPAEQRLVTSADFQSVQAALAKLGADSDSCRAFSRTAEEYRVTYEMLREGKMPQAETLLAKMLNLVLSSDEGGRAQQIDGRTLPDYSVVRKYLGPAGAYLRSLDDGWLLTGCYLPHQN